MNFDMSMRSFQSEQHFLKRTARSQMPTLRHGACHTSRTLVVTNDGLGGSKHQGILVQTSLAQGALPRSSWGRRESHDCCAKKIESP